MQCIKTVRRHHLRQLIEDKITEAESKGHDHIFIDPGTPYRGQMSEVLIEDIADLVLNPTKITKDWFLLENLGKIELMKKASAVSAMSNWASLQMMSNSLGAPTPISLAGIPSGKYYTTGYSSSRSPWISDAFYGHKDDIIKYFKDEIIPEMEKTDFIEPTDILLGKILKIIDFNNPEVGSEEYIEKYLNDLFETSDLKYYGLSAKGIDRHYCYIYRISANRWLCKVVKGDPVRYFGMKDLQLSGVVMDKIDEFGNNFGWPSPNKNDFSFYPTGFDFEWNRETSLYYKAARDDLFSIAIPLEDTY